MKVFFYSKLSVRAKHVIAAPTVKYTIYFLRFSNIIDISREISNTWSISANGKNGGKEHRVHGVHVHRGILIVSSIYVVSVILSLLLYSIDDKVFHIYLVSRMHLEYIPPVTQLCRRTIGPNRHTWLVIYVEFLINTLTADIFCTWVVTFFPGFLCIRLE